jgi:hypothetical protein
MGEEVSRASIEPPTREVSILVPKRAKLPKNFEKFTHFSRDPRVYEIQTHAVALRHGLHSGGNSVELPCACLEL